jgi:hypothetical protein
MVNLLWPKVVKVTGSSSQQHIVNLAWLRLPADILFIAAGVLPLLVAVVLTYFNMRKSGKTIFNLKNSA